MRGLTLTVQSFVNNMALVMRGLTHTVSRLANITDILQSYMLMVMRGVNPHSTKPW